MFDFDFGQNLSSCQDNAGLLEKGGTVENDSSDDLCTAAMRFCVALSCGSNHPVARAVVEAATLAGGSNTGAMSSKIGDASDVELSMFEQVWHKFLQTSIIHLCKHSVNLGFLYIFIAH